MKQNMGNVDRIIRLFLSAIILFFYLTGDITGTAAVILGVLAVVLLITGLMGFCPGYVPFGIRTKKNNKAER